MGRRLLEEFGDGNAPVEADLTKIPITNHQRIPNPQYLICDSLVIALFGGQRVGWMPIKHFGGFHERFGQGWVRVNGFGEVAGGGAHLDGEHAFREEFSCPMADTAYA